jgi:hypothetical protein
MEVMYVRKISFLIVCSLVLMFGLSGCNNSTKNTIKDSIPIQKIAYDSLSTNEKSELIKKEGIIEQKIVTKKIAHLTDDKYDGKKVYAVTFSSKNQVLGDIIVYIDGATQKVVGRGFRK